MLLFFVFDCGRSTIRRTADLQTSAPAMPIATPMAVKSLRQGKSLLGRLNCMMLAVTWCRVCIVLLP